MARILMVGALHRHIVLVRAGAGAIHLVHVRSGCAIIGGVFYGKEWHGNRL